MVAYDDYIVCDYTFLTVALYLYCKSIYKSISDEVCGILLIKQIASYERQLWTRERFSKSAFQTTSHMYICIIMIMRITRI